MKHLFSTRVRIVVILVLLLAVGIFGDLLAEIVKALIRMCL